MHTRIRVHAPAEEVLARINPAVGTVEAVSDTESVLVTGGDSVEVVAVWIGMLGLDFSVTDPPGPGRPPARARAPLREGDQDPRRLLTVELSATTCPGSVDAPFDPTAFEAVPGSHLRPVVGPPLS